MPTIGTIPAAPVPRHQLKDDASNDLVTIDIPMQHSPIAVELLDRPESLGDGVDLIEERQRLGDNVADFDVADVPLAAAWLDRVDAANLIAELAAPTVRQPTPGNGLLAVQDF